MTWIAMFSQTGSEIVNIIKELGKKPDLVVTNNTEEDKYKIHPELRSTVGVMMYAHHDILMNYFRNQNIYSQENTLITLHGYLRIIPPDLCEKYTIYNGHPAAISLYPELKGKDPQIRTWQKNDEYSIIGSVVHKVVPEVDAGDIEVEEYIVNDAKSLDDVYELLKVTSLESWVKFLRGKL